MLNQPPHLKGIVSAPRAYGPARRPIRMAWGSYVSLAFGLWVVLWMAINAGGPAVFESVGAGVMQTVHLIRATFPLFVFVLTLPGLIGRQKLPGPLLLWMIYSLLGLVASFAAPVPIHSLYWATSYLAIFTAMAVCLRREDLLRSTIRLNHVSWLVVTCVLAVLLVVARDQLYVETTTGITGYGLISRMGGSVAGMSMSRETGLARMAAIPAIVCFVLLWRDRSGARKALWLVLSLGSCFLIYVMQSRGALAGLAFAMVVVVYLMGRRFWIMGIAVLLMCVLAVAIEIVPSEISDRILAHLTRGENVEQLTTLTGRTESWTRAWTYVSDNPVLGWGFEADRDLMAMEHVHNTQLYVMLTAGVPGLILVCWGLLWVWFRVLRAARLAMPEHGIEKTTFLQTAGILAFFTVRSIPEVCGVSFTIDSLVMLPAMAYLALLGKRGGPPHG